MKAECGLGQVTVTCGATAECVGVEAKADLGAVTVETPESASPFLPREGIIKTWNSRQGFIARVGHREDLFFHKYSVEADYRPAPGDRVQFEIASSRSGRVYAVKVRSCD